MELEVTHAPPLIWICGLPWPDMLTLSGPSNPATVTTSERIVVLTVWFVRLVKLNAFGVVSWDRVVTDQFAEIEVTLNPTLTAVSKEPDEVTRRATLSPGLTFAVEPTATLLTMIVAPPVAVAVRAPAKPVTVTAFDVIAVLGLAPVTAVKGPLTAGAAPTSCQTVPSQNWTSRCAAS
jgi:hypothetical protein